MANVKDPARIETGWDVFDDESDSVGSISEVGDNYLLVRKGLIFVKDIFIPVSAVKQIDDGAVWLNVPKADIDSMGWGVPPSEGSWDEWARSEREATIAAFRGKERPAR